MIQNETKIVFIKYISQNIITILADAGKYKSGTKFSQV